MVRFLNKNNKEAFTLVELVIVITIVSFLISALAIGYINQLRKARDAKRKTHLQKMRLAFEDYYNDWGCYPDDGAVFEDCRSNVFSPWIKEIYCDPLGNSVFYKVVPQESDCPDWYAIYTNIEYSRDPQLLVNECYGICTVDGEDYNFVVYSEGLVTADLPGLPSSYYEPTNTPIPPPGGPTATSTPTGIPGDPTSTPTITPTPTQFQGPTSIPCGPECYQSVYNSFTGKWDCNGPKSGEVKDGGDGPCTVNCYTDSDCSPTCQIAICNE